MMQKENLLYLALEKSLLGHLRFKARCGAVSQQSTVEESRNGASELQRLFLKCVRPALFEKI